MAENKAGIRFTPEHYVFIDLDPAVRTVTETVGDETKVYTLNEVERKRLFTNPDISIEMVDEVLFAESEIEGYQYLAFVLTTTSGDYEVEEWCEIEPLKNHGGKFVVSMPGTGGVGDIFCRKIYRSSGEVKPSVKVYELGKTTENREYCIIKSVDAIKGV